MIRKTDAQSLRAALGRLATAPGFGAQMYVDACMALQNPASGYDFYSLDSGALLEVDMVRAYLVGQPDDGEELALFLARRGVCFYTSDGFLPLGWQQGDCVAMHLPPGGTGEPQPPQGFDACPPADEVMEVLAEDAPWTQAARDRMYFTLCMRRNHNGADIVGIREGGRLVATAGIWCFTPRECFIMNVKTRRAARGRRYASQLVRTLCERHAAIPKGLLCTRALTSFYGPMGFTIQEGGRVIVAQPPALESGIL